MPGKLKGLLSNEKIINLTSFAAYVHYYKQLSILAFSQKRGLKCEQCADSRCVPVRVQGGGWKPARVGVLARVRDRPRGRLPPTTRLRVRELEWGEKVQSAK